jgi:hypothetical protein
MSRKKKSASFTKANKRAVAARNARVRREKIEAKMAEAGAAMLQETILKKVVPAAKRVIAEVLEANTPGYSTGRPPDTSEHGSDWYNAMSRDAAKYPGHELLTPDGATTKSEETFSPDGSVHVAKAEDAALAAQWAEHVVPILKKLDVELKIMKAKTDAVHSVVAHFGGWAPAVDFMQYARSVGNPLFLSTGDLNPEFVSEDM